MLSLSFINECIDYILFICCLFILFGGVFLTVKTRFVQIRLFPELFRLLKTSFFHRQLVKNPHTIPPHKALFTAMSTTLGISTIVAPVIAIKLGGPGALIGFLLTSFFGSAATYTEVSLSIKYRKQFSTGTVMGGPMHYLEHLLSPFAAKWYAICCLILLMAWSGTQANQVVAILDSPLLGNYRIPSVLSGGVIALLVMIVMMGGIRRVSSFSAKLVPIMFMLYLGSTLWIILCNCDKLWSIFSEIFQAAFSPYALASGTVVGGITNALRWGVFKGIQTNEAGIGTQAFPHAAAETQDPASQGALAMLSTYAAGFIAFLSGCVCLLTKTWQNPHLPLGISMVAASFQHYFSYFGIIIVAMSTVLFGFGTILGNCYNGSQCYRYLITKRSIHYYLVAMALMVFLGAISEVVTLWSFIDIGLACIALPHMTALLFYATKKSRLVEDLPQDFYGI